MGSCPYYRASWGALHNIALHEAFAGHKREAVLDNRSDVGPRTKFVNGAALNHRRGLTTQQNSGLMFLV